MASVSRYGSSYSVFSVNSAGRIVSSKPGTLGALIISDVGATAVIDFYDNKLGDTSGNKVASWVTADGKAIQAYGIPMAKGISMVQAGGTAANVTVVWE